MKKARFSLEHLLLWKMVRLIVLHSIIELASLSLKSGFAACFDKRDEAIRSASVKLLFNAAWPEHIDVVDRGAGAEAEVRAEIVVGYIA